MQKRDKSVSIDKIGNVNELASKDLCIHPKNTLFGTVLLSGI